MPPENQLCSPAGIEKLVSLDKKKKKDFSFSLKLLFDIVFFRAE